MVDVRFEPEKLKPPTNIDEDSVLSPMAVRDLINEILGKAVKITWKSEPELTYKLRFMVGAEAEVYIFDDRDQEPFKPIKTDWEMFLRVDDKTVAKFIQYVTIDEDDIRRALYRIYNTWLMHRGQGQRL